MAKIRESRYELWRRKLSYLVKHHGALGAIARATRLKPKSIEGLAKGLPDGGQGQPLQLERETVKQIETALDLPEGWFDASAFLPSRL